MSKNKMDIAKVLAVLAQPKKELPPIENVERMRIVVPYITKEKKVEERAVRVVIPQNVVKPMPLIYVPHYEMGEDSLELRDYLEKGWAVACPAEFDNNYNATLTDDDLVFNNAVLYTLRNMERFDKNRICVIGGSAGGYTAMMLNGLQLGLCASIANGPITNTYFNFHYYFPKTNSINLQAIEKKMADKATNGEVEEKNEKTPMELMESLSEVPIPFLAGVAGMFEPVGNNFPNKEDFDRWEAFSAIGLADCFCSPIMVNHNTSDVLVPVDQISRRFTYTEPGDSLRGIGYDSRLPETFPGNLKHSLEECLPAEDTRVERIAVPVEAGESNLSYDNSKKFNINIFDDGPVEGYGSHSSRMDVGRRFDTPYIQEMLEKTAATTCVLTPAMLKELLIRYQGNSRTLPAYIGVDDNVYGSLKIYQKEICQELKDWCDNYGKVELEKVFDTLFESEPDKNFRKDYQNSMEEIRKGCEF